MRDQLEMWWIVSAMLKNRLHWGTNQNKEDVVWDISPDSTLLGVTDT